MKNTNNNYAVLFKAINNDDSISYQPVDILIGTYDNNSHIFYDRKKTPYKHLIEIPDSFGFAFRTEVEEKIKKYNNIPFTIVKTLLLNAIKKYEYITATIEDTNTPAILITNKKTKEQEILLEDDALMYYKKRHPAFLKILNKANDKEEVEEEININIKSLYESITENIVGQDEQVKEILSAIWKQFNDYSEDKARNILIDGSTAVGKTEIIKNIMKNSNIPIVMSSITEFIPNGTEAKSISELVFSLIDKANGNIDKAQRGIIVIDDIDKITDNNIYSMSFIKHLQEELIKLADSESIDLIYDYNEFTFDTSKLLFIIIGNFSRSNKKKDKIVGFNNDNNYKDINNRDYYVQTELLPEFINKFPIIIKMNDLNYESFIKILKNSKIGALYLNKEYFDKRGINLCYDDKVISKIATIAVDSSFGARSIDETIEKALSLASFEIAVNPKLYSRLIITEETIEDNKSYKLIRKKKQ